MELPFISVVMPTFNSARVLERALSSVINQNYPKDKLEIIIADGGSTDKTLEIARKYTELIYSNPLKTGEAGKAVGVKKAQGSLIALVDSDNILPTKDWFLKIIEPFANPEIIGSEPIEYTYRPQDNYITRYCALMGMNDPLCFFLGNYDRLNLISQRWTGLKIESEDRGNYLEIALEPDEFPTIGANGTVIRKKYLENIGDYLMDIDVIFDLARKGKNKFAKVKIGIVHLFCGDLRTFCRKQKRRIQDYLYFKAQGTRSYPWQKQSKAGLVKFIVYCFLLFPLLLQSFVGYSRKRDWAWWLHPIFCWITLWVYGWGMLVGFFKKEEMKRDKWGQ